MRLHRRRSVVRCLALALAGQAAAFPVVSGGAGPAGAPASACGRGEVTYFACAMSRSRVARVCGDVPRGLQYRFGTRASTELVHPEGRPAGTGDFRLAQYARYRTERVELAFEREGHRYVVFQSDEAGRRRAGIRVTEPAGRERELTCIGKAVTELQRLRGHVPCDRDNALNLGNCP